MKILSMKTTFLACLLLGISACASVPPENPRCYSGVLDENYGGSIDLCYTASANRNTYMILNFPNNRQGKQESCSAPAKLLGSDSELVFKGLGGRCSSGRKLAKLEYECSGFPESNITCKNKKSGKKYSLILLESPRPHQACSLDVMCGSCSVICPIGKTAVCNKGSYHWDPSPIGGSDCTTKASCKCK